MKKSGSQNSKSPSQLIDARIKELSDWRGKMLSRLRTLVKEADPEVVEEWKWRGVVIGMLITNVFFRPFDRHGFLRRLGRQRGNIVEPTNAAFEPVMADRGNILWSVETAERDRNRVSIVIAEAQWRSAARAEITVGK
jgi:hypothetical protein